MDSQPGNPELAPASGMATINGKINSEEDMTMILVGGDYYASIETTAGGQFSFENVPNGSYNLSANPSGPGASCGQITVSVPEGHRVLTYNYRFYKMQCAPIP